MKKPAVLEHLHYIAKRTFKGHALFIALSKTQKETIKEQILSAIQEYEHAHSCTAFTLNNKDILLFFNNNKAHHLMLLALKIKAITGIKIYEKIISVYDLKTDYARLHNRVYNLVLAPETNKLHTLSVMQKIPHKPFTLEHLERVLNHLENTSLNHLIRKQTVSSFTPQDNGCPLFTSWFVDLIDIRRILIPDVDILENKFFYSILRSAVEKKVLQKIQTIPNWIGGINVSVSLFRTPLMKEWLKSHTQTQKQNILFDFSFDDVLTNRTDYQKIKQALEPSGYRFIIRINSHRVFLNKKSLPADYVKIPADNLLTYGLNTLEPQDIIAIGVRNTSIHKQLMQTGIFQIQGLHNTPASGL
ncbi:MAG: hypothetical protein IKV03_00325 [Alphaproteobacteria bacterium]|nr:hypothetical protein [Alphaproteobacteria bacterium]